MKLKKLEDLLQAEFAVSMVGQTMNVSVFFIDGLLIDTGPKRHKQMLTALFENWDIEKVAITHHHEDHTGVAHWIEERNKAPIFMHPLGVEICAKKVKLPFYRKVYWGGVKPFQAQPIDETFDTENYTWKAIHTPGHAEDHIALYNQEKGWLFGGDLYVPAKPKSAFRFESVPEIIRSLRKLLTYDFETYICSHQGVVFEGKKAIREKLDYLLSLQQEVLFLFNKGMTPREIREELLPKRHKMHYLSLFENSPMHFIHSVIGEDALSKRSFEKETLN